ncbi:MAG: sulfatase-like hydrolase/transferase, partial [Planctomycetota bacterium]|nr:sulfatase-like hydrolase/transferase [Planctomycetota bacterium]
MKRILFAILLSGLAPQSASAQPNIVLILADDVGCEPIGAYGGERWKTPHIDALAGSGMRFDYCFSMPVCHPTRLCLMTGKYPFRLKSGWGTFPRAEEKQSLAAVLKRAGYRTAIAGKWQLCLMKKDTDQPARMGFDEWSVFGWHEGARYHEPMIYQDGRVRSDTTGKYGPELYVEFLGDFMERSSKAQKPFFAYYSMALAHDVTDDLRTQVPYVPGKDRWMNYGEMIESMDLMVGKLLARLDQLGLRENTLVFFTGDNGTARRSKLRHISKRKYEQENVYSVRKSQRVPGGKGTLLDIGTNVPLIAS